MVRRLLLCLVLGVVWCEEKDFTPGRQPNSKRRVSDGLTYEEERALRKAKRDALPKTPEGRWEYVKESFNRLNDPLERAKMLEKQGMARQFGQTDEQYRRMKSVYGRMARDEVNRLEKEKANKLKQAKEDEEFRRKRAEFFGRGKQGSENSGLMKAGGLAGLAGIPIIGGLVTGKQKKEVIQAPIPVVTEKSIQVPTKVVIGSAAVMLAAGLVKTILVAVSSKESEPKYTPPPSYGIRRERPASPPSPPAQTEDVIDPVTPETFSPAPSGEDTDATDLTSSVVEESAVDDIVETLSPSHLSLKEDVAVSTQEEPVAEEKETTSSTVTDSTDFAQAHAASSAKRPELNPTGMSHEAMEKLEKARLRDELLGRIEARYKLLSKSVPAETTKLSIAELRTELESLRAEQGANLAPAAPTAKRVAMKPVPSGGGTGTPKPPLNFADVEHLGTNFKAAAAKKKKIEERRARRGRRGGLVGAVGRGLGALVGRGRKNRLALVVVDPNKCALFPYKASKPEVSFSQGAPVCIAKPRSSMPPPKKVPSPQTATTIDATPEIFTTSDSVETKTFPVAQKHSIAARPPDDLMVSRETVCEAGSISTNFRSAASAGDRAIDTSAAARIAVSKAGATKTNFRAAAAKTS